MFLKRKGMKIHLGGIGKGYAVDHAVQILRGAGLRDFMIQAGGDLYVGGHKDGQPWRLGINDPRGPDGQSFATIDLTDSTFSTSGDYARFFMKDGVRYHHILDPAHRPAGAPVPQRDDRRRRARCSPTRSRKACSSSDRKRAWRWSSASRSWKR